LFKESKETYDRAQTRDLTITNQKQITTTPKLHLCLEFPYLRLFVSNNALWEHLSLQIVIIF